MTELQMNILNRSHDDNFNYVKSEPDTLEEFENYWKNPESITSFNSFKIKH